MSQSRITSITFGFLLGLLLGGCAHQPQVIMAADYEGENAGAEAEKTDLGVVRSRPRTEFVRRAERDWPRHAVTIFSYEMGKR